jgi:hypothetical protein
MKNQDDEDLSSALVMIVFYISFGVVCLFLVRGCITNMSMESCIQKQHMEWRNNDCVRSPR